MQKIDVKGKGKPAGLNPPAFVKPPAAVPVAEELDDFTPVTSTAPQADLAQPKTKVELLESRLKLFEAGLLELMELVDSLEKKLIDTTKDIEELKKVGPGKKGGLFGGKREKTAIKDLTTGKIYGSKSAAGKSLATEFGLDPFNTLSWYKIEAQSPDRFVPATSAEAEKVWADEKAAMEKYVAEENARLTKLTGK